MSETVIQVDHLSKEYRLGQIGGKRLVDDVNRLWARFRGQEDPLSKVGSPVVDRHNGNGNGQRRTPASGGESTDASGLNQIWALKDVSLDVKEGEVLGIIGRNGAGKSTLLKILSRVTAPSEGEVRIKGRIASLLEVGTGFHPDLTGRENIFLNGAILGMTKAEIRSKFDEIVAFAEVEKFIDTPVKRYSSGMYVRLAFGVAAHLEPEILIIDEVLAVGDAQFQKKCLGKMGDVARHGRTVIFVSHNLTAVQSLCQRSVWLDRGQIMEDGPTGQVVSSYLKTSFSSLTERRWSDLEDAPGSETVKFHRMCIRPEAGSPRDPITVRTPFTIEFEYWNLEPGAPLNLSLHILNEHGVTVFNTAPVNEPVWNGRGFPDGLFRSVCRVPCDLLNNGVHRVMLLVVKNAGVIIYRMEEALVFEVREVSREGYFGEWPGAVRPDLEWTTELLESNSVSVNAAMKGVSNLPTSRELAGRAGRDR